jgi:hypothetical protein
MGADLNNVLATVALDVFEQLGFLLADPEPMEDEPELVGMRVDFEGPSRGAVVVWGDDVLREALASGMLGTFDVPEPELLHDALGEVANVICGNVVPQVYDAAADYRLHAPHPVIDSADSGSEPAGRVTLGFEGGVARIDWFETIS